MAYRLGVDVGGTFTDLLLVDEDTGDLTRVKTPSTPADPSQGVLAGVKRILEQRDVSLKKVSHLLHGTTVATNAVLESKGARVGLITTQGFKQILHLARSQTPGPLAGWIIMIKPDPPAALEDTREAKERISAQGEVVEALDGEQVRSIVQNLVDSGVESLTVSLINSFTNSTHEREIKKIIQELYPDFPVTISSDVLPEIREYERTLTACMNSYVRPKVEGYLRNLEYALGNLGFKGTINILRSDAGLMTTQLAKEKPIYAVLSGPAGGVAGALFVAQRAGYENILTFDMGGTSTDVALCQEGQPTIARETELGYFRVKVPSVNVHSVGAGGGSIVHVPEITKALRVGPQSAGAEPGPACYGKGGTEPTVTDANVVVGHLPPQLLGGEMKLDPEAAKTAVKTIGDALGLDVQEAAQGILDIVNENMAGALRVVSVQRGYDPRDFALVAFGGAGPMHANAVARLSGSFPVIVPPAPGLLCATGDLVADFRDEFARTFIRKLDSVSNDEIVRILEELGAEAKDWMKREGIPGKSQVFSYNIDMRYYRQGYEIPVEITVEQLAESGVDFLAERFNDIHEQFYGFRMEDTPCEIVNLRAVGLGKVPELHFPEKKADKSTDSSHAVIDEHEVYFEGSWIPTKIYAREKLRPNNQIQGPAIVTEFDSTTVILSGHQAEVDRYLNILINPAKKLGD
ncbi:MAG: hydantoinase/oxoprolinase family protein [Acidobacteria bacterium]|nr:MAG: hydantoinase/oxoprolinase family protein [Acidobacteriota bacterium]